MPPFSNRLSRVSLLALALGLSIHIAEAGSATWSSNPTSNNWDRAENWTPATVPRGPNDVAIFAASNLPNVFISRPTGVKSIVFSADAPDFTIEASEGETLTIGDGGTSNESGRTQNFLVSAGGSLSFVGTAVVGMDTMFTNMDGNILFQGGASAGNGIFLNQAGGLISFLRHATAGYGTFTTAGRITFSSATTAGNAVLNIAGGEAKDSPGGTVRFGRLSTAGDAIITVNGAASPRAAPGLLFFDTYATAGNATLVANGGSGGGAGGIIRFNYYTRGTTGPLRLYGNSVLDASNSTLSNLRFGSIEGTGTIVFSLSLYVGYNNTDTVFSGVLTDDGTGDLEKVGSGTLTLTGASTYREGTYVRGGDLLINNTIGSGTGTGEVSVFNGRLGGSGTIAGAITAGIGQHGQAYLSPGALGNHSFGILTIQGGIDFGSNGVYEFEAGNMPPASDQVVANGVTIEDSAQFLITLKGDKPLPVGTVFTAIKNTEGSPIDGTFSNLPDHSTFSANGNTFQVNYEGGDGNDLTVTVLP